jgi:hypothetical protein
MDAQRRRQNPVVGFGKTALKIATSKPGSLACGFLPENEGVENRQSRSAVPQTALPAYASRVNVNQSELTKQ